MKQVIFIAGCGHSGSTVLGLMLGNHPLFVGVGEVYNLFNPKLKEQNWLERSKEVMCSCGRLGGECEFWGPSLERLREVEQQGSKPHASYKSFLEVFYRHFGAEYTPVDISKTDDALKALLRQKEITVKIIFLIRDIRSWTVSRREIRRRAGELNPIDLIKKYGLKAWKAYLVGTPAYYFWEWYYLNRRTQKFLRDSNLEYIQVGYEELTLYPEFVMPKICDFLHIDFMEHLLRLDDNSSHVLLGNRMRSDREKRLRVTYDARWLYSKDWQMAAVVFPFIANYSNREVYRNVREHLWNK
jgi:hypothetical protein